jgi:hypothetical protein
VALKAPLDSAVFTLNLHLFLSKSPHSSNWEMMFCDVRAVRARFPAVVTLGIYSQPLKTNFILLIEVGKNFRSANGVTAFGVGTGKFYEAVV